MITYAERNAMARQLCGLPPSKQYPVVQTEQELIAADIANSRNKVERHDAAALKVQIQTQQKTGAA